MLEKNLILIGFASSGKTVIGTELGKILDWDFLDLDRLIEQLYKARFKKSLSCRKIFQQNGDTFFRDLENEALTELKLSTSSILATGGGTPLRSENVRLLKELGTIVYLASTPNVIWERFKANGFPAYLAANPTITNLSRVWGKRDLVYRNNSDHIIDTGNFGIKAIAEKIVLL